MAEIVAIDELFGNIASAHSDKDILQITRKYILHGIPHVFLSKPDEYYDFRNLIAEHFNIDYRNVFIVGSAKLGYSYWKRTKFSLESDIDVAIVNPHLFDYYQKFICDFQYNVQNGNVRMTKEQYDLYISFLKYFAQGWLRPDKIPASQQLLIMKDEWFQYFKSISYGRCCVGNYKVNAGLYKNFNYLETYFIN